MSVFNYKHIGLMMRKYISAIGKITYYQNKKQQLNAQIIAGIRLLNGADPIVSVPPRKFIKVSIEEYDGYIIKEDAAGILKELVPDLIYKQSVVPMVDVSKLKELKVDVSIIEQLYNKVHYENIKYEVVPKPKK